MKGRKPGISRFRRAFLVAATAIGLTTGSVGIDNLPKDPVTDTHITFQTGSADQYGYNISPIDQMWKHTLVMKSDAQRDLDLLAAAQDGDSWRIRALAEHGINTEVAGARALAAGAGAGHADVVDALLKAGVKADAHVNAALVAAAKNNHAAIALTLLENGALASALIARGADANAQDGMALQAAIQGGHADVADTLLSATRTVAVSIPVAPDYSIWTGAKPFDQHISPNRFGPPPFFSPIDDPFNMNFTLAERPIIDVNANNGQALYDAVYKNDIDMARVLMKHGADANAKDGAIKQLANESRNTAMVNLLNGNTPAAPSFTPPGI
ncbi:MAG: hypothetical protein H3C49_03495 [Alphaproteobacteria bacterium]|nr:hypothetical protein [Alphaproteobacteria bacterium]